MNQRDRLKNNVFWYLCLHEPFTRTKEMHELIEVCFARNPDIDTPNVAGNTTRGLLENSPVEALRRLAQKEE